MTTETDTADAARAAVPDGWTWTLVDVTCGACGATNQIHDQPPEWLDRPEGVRWECSACGAHNVLGGHPEAPPADYVLECAHCHRTWDPNTIEQADDGTWTCPEDRGGCGVEQRHIRLTETGTGTQTGAIG